MDEQAEAVRAHLAAGLRFGARAPEPGGARYCPWAGMRAGVRRAAQGDPDARGARTGPKTGPARDAKRGVAREPVIQAARSGRNIASPKLRNRYPFATAWR